MFLWIICYVVSVVEHHIGFVNVIFGSGSLLRENAYVFPYLRQVSYDVRSTGWFVVDEWWVSADHCSPQSLPNACTSILSSLVQSTYVTTLLPPPFSPTLSIPLLPQMSLTILF